MTIEQMENWRKSINEQIDGMITLAKIQAEMEANQSEWAAIAAAGQEVRRGNPPQPPRCEQARKAEEWLAKEMSALLQAADREGQRRMRERCDNYLKEGCFGVDVLRQIPLE